MQITCELSILILSVFCHFQCNFCMTVTMLQLSCKRYACNVDNKACKSIIIIMKMYIVQKYTEKMKNKK